MMRLGRRIYLKISIALFGSDLFEKSESDWTGADRTSREKPYSFLEVLSYSSTLSAITGLALLLATNGSFDRDSSLTTLSIVFFGTLGIYNLDRIRDLARDTLHTPGRSKFIFRHKGKLGVLCFGSGALAFSLLLFSGLPMSLRLLPIVLLGIFHRRLKTRPFWKSIYVAAGWAATLLILADIGSTSPRDWGKTALVLFFSLFANTSISGAFAIQRSSRTAIGSAVAAGLIACTLDPIGRCLILLAIFSGIGALWAHQSKYHRSIAPDCTLSIGAALSWFAS